jgi:hypothetical protein
MGQLKRELGQLLLLLPQCPSAHVVLITASAKVFATGLQTVLARRLVIASFLQPAFQSLFPPTFNHRFKNHPANQRSNQLLTNRVRQVDEPEPEAIDDGAPAKKLSDSRGFAAAAGQNHSLNFVNLEAPSPTNGRGCPPAPTNPTQQLHLCPRVPSRLPSRFRPAPASASVFCGSVAVPAAVTRRGAARQSLLWGQQRGHQVPAPAPSPRHTHMPVGREQTGGRARRATDGAVAKRSRRVLRGY